MFFIFFIFLNQYNAEFILAKKINKEQSEENKIPKNPKLIY